MPELPEVETIRRDLEREVVGKRDQDGRGHRARARSAGTPTRSSSSPGSRAARSPASTGRASTCCSRSTPATCSSSTCGMSGQLLRAGAPRTPVAKHTHVVITFTQGGQLRFVDPRTFGELFVDRRPRSSPTRSPELADLGFDPVDEPMSWTGFGDLLLGASRRS